MPWRAYGKNVPFGVKLQWAVADKIVYSKIRAGLGVSPADAIHLACAAQEGVDLFLTNDRRLVGQIVAGIQFIAGIDSDLF